MPCLEVDAADSEHVIDVQTQSSRLIGEEPQTHKPRLEVDAADSESGRVVGEEPQTDEPCLEVDAADSESSRLVSVGAVADAHHVNMTVSEHQYHSQHPLFTMHQQPDGSFIIPAETLSSVEVGTMLQVDLKYSNVLHVVDDGADTSLAVSHNFEAEANNSSDESESDIIDDESSVEDDNSEEEPNENEDDNNNSSSSDRPHGSRWKRAHPERWKRNIAKKIKLSTKKPKTKTCTGCRWKCTEHFTDCDRNQLCAAYVGLESYKRKKDFLLSNINITGKKRERIRGATGQRQKARSVCLEYFFMKNSERIRVCKQFFMATLAIGHSPISEAVRGCSETGHYDGEDRRGKHVPNNKTTDVDVALVRKHIESFPKMPSHYTRRDSKKEYLDQGLNITKMYSLYKEYCSMQNPPATAVSPAIYRRVFGTEYNLSFFHPRKDQCELCTKYLAADDTMKRELKSNYEQHVAMKNQCQEAKAADKNEASQKSNMAIATFDLQSVLQTPCSQVSTLYYSRKLNMYNLTVYSMKPPHDAVCYCWTEVEGKRGSNEIGTSMYKWLTGLPDTVDEVIIYSDSCGGQNRNRHMAAILLYAVQMTKLKVVYQKFLERGHTYMEVDSMHSAVEFAKRNVAVYSPHGWQNIFRAARKRRPYEVVRLEHTDFIDLKHLSSTIMRAASASRINWMKVKCLKFEKNQAGVIQFRYSHEGDYQSVNVCGRCQPQKYTTVQAYKNKVPISTAKYKDLQTLAQKHIIPKEFHSWYASLPCSSTSVDKVAEPCVGDSGEESD